MNLHATFDDTRNQIEVSAEYDSSGQHKILLSLVQPPSMVSVSQEANLDRPVEESPSDRISDYIAPKASLPVEPSAASQTRLVSRLGLLEGKLSITHSRLTDLVEQLPDGISDLARQLSSDPTSSPLEFAVSGAWNRVELQLNAAPPASVAGEIEREAQAQLQQAIVRKVAQLDADFERQLLAVRYLVESAASDMKQQILADSQQLYANQQSLQQRLNEMQGIEFARRPDGISR